ncbi:MAG: hypothetical protein A2741_02830 [Candidatus Zambryskibacteria bacterium RIFCSPHIGHO2_01_FULL_43_27]|uniref:Glucose-6-phosphate isomerase n=1 Tax=Candidatus Zambryskibacteria bacterium RIFCSPLOWO2_01_FULL_43_17 TaxID=1802760 RepID=A0A1G2U221_9BACT|nr:MAG: hypothetical protein A2741_02830 [Candidatus Zambryskibacteria bacterium RIFCSPHIGHO2_01_FULL_43_27]OHB00144.1 MAG: hypothetical protein A3E93_01175 [Candidatus Zambryskibacteria bacterium RIFCSPHIGHO2_12_FULL_43_12b]OHB03534.1 MAG: hypothetical protein A2920_00395 [Candidatus Zambryskibacteria bacterium RIFCSPLOWO2_01_FULL_43_17]
MTILLRQKINIEGKEKKTVKANLEEVLRKLIAFSEDFSYREHESLFAFLNDKDLLEKLTALVKKINGHHLPKTVFVIGIGGANLATKAIHDALSGYGESAYDAERKMIFLDTVDESVSEPVLLHIKTLNKKEDFVVVIVSKSGETLETLANTEFLLSHLEARFGDIRDRTVVVTGGGSKLDLSAKEKNISLVLLPDVFSDRFGAFSPTTLLPMMLYGYPADDLLSGAREVFRKFIGLKENISLETAFAIDEEYGRGHNIYDLFFFSPRLETLGKWHRQLVAESLGKTGKGITPTVSIGTTDLHSSLQLVLDGPKNKITSFVSVHLSEEESIGDSLEIDALSANVTSKSFSEINNAILQSVQESYFKNNLPYFDIILSDISLKTIGEYMTFAMLQTIFLSKLWSVNAFDQPAVEEYKTRAKRALE